MPGEVNKRFVAQKCNLNGTQFTLYSSTATAFDKLSGVLPLDGEPYIVAPRNKNDGKPPPKPSALKQTTSEIINSGSPRVPDNVKDEPPYPPIRIDVPPRSEARKPTAPVKQEQNKPQEVAESILPPRFDPDVYELQKKNRSWCFYKVISLLFFLAPLFLAILIIIISEMLRTSNLELSREIYELAYDTLQNFYRSFVSIGAILFFGYMGNLKGVNSSFDNIKKLFKQISNLILFYSANIVIFSAFAIIDLLNDSAYAAVIDFANAAFIVVELIVIIKAKSYFTSSRSNKYFNIKSTDRQFLSDSSIYKPLPSFWLIGVMAVLVAAGPFLYYAIYYDVQPAAPKSEYSLADKTDATTAAPTPGKSNSRDYDASNDAVRDLQERLEERASGAIASVDRPADGEILIDNCFGLPSLAPFNIEIKDTYDHYFVLADKSDNIILAFYVRGKPHNSVYSKTTELTVPLGEYYVFEASGRDWRGVDELFASDFSGCSYDETLVFYDNGEYYSGYTLIAYPAVDGNLSDTTVFKSNFPRP